MKKIERIVVGTDFSEVAEHVDHAVDLAALVGAAVTIVHAYEMPLGPPGAVAVTAVDTVRALTDDATRRLDADSSKRRDRGVPINTLLRVGAPWDELNAVAAQHSADLIVVGTHGRRGLSRALIGSVAERLIRTAYCPVLVIHAGVPRP